MATIYELLQNMNPDINNANQPKMSIQDLIAANEQKKIDLQNQQNFQAQAQQPAANIAMPENTNIPAQNILNPAQPNIGAQPEIQPEAEKSNLQTIKDLSRDDIQKDMDYFKNFNIKNLMENKPKISAEMEPYQERPKPYSAKDFGKYFKKGKGFWGKTGGALADLLMALNTPEGQKLTGSLLFASTGNPYMVGAANEQAQMTAQRQAQEQQQYNDYIKDLRKTSTEYDMKMADILGKEAYAALKGGKGILYIDKTNGKAYLPETQADGSVENIEVNPNDYKGYITKDLFKPQIDEAAKLTAYKNKLDLSTQAFAQRKSLGEQIEIGYTGQKEAAKMQPGTSQYANLATKLSDDYRGDIKDYATLRQNYKTMETVLDASLKNPKMSMMTVDQALITTFNKMLDPGSVVRESEYARTPEGQAKLTQVQGFLDKLKQGGAGLTPKERVSMVQTASKLMNAGNDYYNEKRKSYSDMANEYGVKPSLVVGKDLSYTPKTFNFSQSKSNTQAKPVDKKIENLRNKYQY